MVLKNAPFPIVVTGADSESIALQFELVSEPSHGTLIGILPHVTYAPAPNYLGVDSFTFRVSDGQATSSTATVSITVVDWVWRRKGPDGGRVTTIVDDPRDPGVAYAGIATGGFVRTLDGGASWHPLSTGLNGIASDDRSRRRVHPPDVWPCNPGD